jgi:MFS family permease
VLAVDNLVRGVAIASVPIAAAMGSLTTAHLFVVSAIYGLLYMTSIAGIPSLIPSLVRPDELTTANAMESITYGIAGLVGPALAGVVIALIGAPVVLALDALTYGVFVACLLAMRSGGMVQVSATAEGDADPGPVAVRRPIRRSNRRTRRRLEGRGSARRSASSWARRRSSPRPRCTCA